MTDKKKTTETSNIKLTAKDTSKSGHCVGKSESGHCFSSKGDIFCRAKGNPTVTRSKLPEPTEPPPTPIVAKPKK